MHGRRQVASCVFWFLAGVGAFSQFEGSLLRGLLIFLGVLAVAIAASAARGWLTRLWTGRRRGSPPANGG